MKTKFSGILTLLLAFVVQFTFAQEKTITGTVSDGSGPLPGVTVFIKGTNTGTETDFDGKYTIKAESGKTLVFSFVGMKTKEVIIGASNTVNITLESDNLLDEVIVTGVATGTSTKKLGFKVEKVGLDGVQNVPTPDAASALTGKVAGAQIVRGSGNPLRNSAIILRGASSIEGSAEPLVIIDGIITEGGLRDVNMDDVESIEVVKGAAASSLYGSLAGNGVIQIITKKGKSGKAKISIKSEYGFSQKTKDYPLATKHAKLVNPDGSVDYSKDDPDGLFDNDFDKPIINNLDNFIKSQPYSQFSISASQKQENINYYTSVQQSKVNGIIEGVNPYIRQNFRLNVNADLTKKLSVGVSGNYTKTKGQEVEQSGQGDNLFYNFLTSNPTTDISERNPDGSLIPVFPGNGWINEFQNPVYVASVQRKDRRETRLVGGINTTYTFNDNLNFQTTLSMDKNNFQYENFYPKGYVSAGVPTPGTDNGRIFIRNSTSERVNASAQLNFNKTFGDFAFRSSLKYLHESVSYNRQDGRSFNFLTAGVDNLQQGQEGKVVSSYRSLIKSQNYFLSADLDWKDKVIIGGVVRTDRSSLFGENNRDQLFYRGSFAYRLGEDLKQDWINELKLRASYGTAGLRPDFGDIFETFTVTPSNITFTQVGNPDLKSPTIGELELGIDFHFLDNYKLGLTYADSKTKDALLTVPLSGAVSGQRTIRNIGETKYTAYEASFSGTPITKGDFSWNFGLTWSKVKNEYVSLGNVAPFNRVFGGNLFDNAPAKPLFRVQAGQVYGAMFGNKLARSLEDLTVVNGVVINEGLNLPISAFEVNEHGHVVVSANKGVNATVAQGGEQAIRMWDKDTNQKLSTVIGDTNPDFIMGISNTFNYKKLSLYTLLDIQSGGNVYNYTRQYLYFNDRHADLQTFGAAGRPANYANSSSNIYNGGDAIDYFAEDASFVKIREISLSYILDKDTFKKELPIESVRFVLSGRNLVTFSDYTGWDPEVSVNSSAIFKYDDFSYPNFRTYAATIQINF